MNMSKDTRSYIKVTTDMPRNPKLSTLSKGQRFLIVEAWCHCGDYLTDGVIDMATWRKMDSKRNRDAVLATGIAVTISDKFPTNFGKISEKFFDQAGYELPTNCVFFPDYLDHQSSRADVQKKRDQSRSAGRKGGQAKAAKASETLSETSSETLSETLSEPSSGFVPEEEVEEELKNLKNPPRPPQGGTTPRGGLTVIEGGADAPAATTKPKRTRTAKAPAARIQEGWTPTREVVEAAQAKHPGLNLRYETEKFVDHFVGTGGVKADWTAAWRNWMRRASEGGPGGRGSSPASRPVNPNGTPLTPAEMKRAAAETLKDRPDAAILARAGYTLTDAQRRNLGLAPVIDGAGFGYDGTLLDAAPARPSMFDQFALDA